MDIVLALKKFCAETIEAEKWGPEVPIVLMDLGMNPIYEMTARKNGDVYVFENERFVSGTVQRPGPYTVRFMVEGKPILRDFAV
jgi:hypothetical protein